jgi:hypothetical protein
MAARVTRLGEFSPNGRLFALGSYLKMKKVAHILGDSLFHGEGYAIILTKNVLGFYFIVAILSCNVDTLI